MRIALRAAALFLLFQALPAFASVRDDVKKGNLLYNTNKYAEAAKFYQEALAKEPSSGIAAFNLGLAKYRTNGYDASIEKFNNAIASGAAGLIPMADYNIGNAEYRIGAAAENSSDIKKAGEAYETALKFYKRSMDLNPSDKDAKFNYEFVEKKLKDLAEKYQFKKDEKKKQDKDKKQDQRQNKQQNQQQQDQEKEQQGQQKDRQNQKKEQQESRDQNSQEQEKNQQQKNDQQKEEQEQQAKEREEKQQDRGGEGEEKPEGQKEQEEPQKGEDQKQKEEQKQGEGKKEEEPNGGAEEEEQRSGQPEEAGQEDRDLPQPISGTENEKERPEQGGLQAYQGSQSEENGVEMSAQEAKMLLEGYKGEEATGRAVKLRQKKIDLPEPSKNW
jgi:Ca-activated chloride channel family protein